jgi:hypothetical protein
MIDDQGALSKFSLALRADNTQEEPLTALEYKLLEGERRAEAKHQADLDQIIARAHSEGKTAEQIKKLVTAHNAMRACVGEVPDDFVEQELGESYQTPKAATGFARVSMGHRSQLVACACPDCANRVRRTSNRQVYCSDACRQRAKKFRTVSE